MEVKRCDRCGNFITSYDNICIPCANKDNADIQNLKNYFEDNTDTYSIQELSFSTGITEKNLNRYMESKDFASHLGNNETGINNISVN